MPYLPSNITNIQGLIPFGDSCGPRGARGLMGKAWGVDPQGDKSDADRNISGHCLVQVAHE